MQHIRRILVAIKNPKARSSPAIVKAAQLAHACCADLELFHCIAETLYIDSKRTTEVVRLAKHDIRARCLEQLELIANRLRRDGLKVTSSAEWATRLSSWEPFRGIVPRDDAQRVVIPSCGDHLAVLMDGAHGKHRVSRSSQ